MLQPIPPPQPPVMLQYAAHEEVHKLVDSSNPIPEVRQTREHEIYAKASALAIASPTSSPEIVAPFEGRGDTQTRRRGDAGREDFPLHPYSPHPSDRREQPPRSETRGEKTFPYTPTPHTPATEGSEPPIQAEKSAALLGPPISVSDHSYSSLGANFANQPTPKSVAQQSLQPDEQKVDKQPEPSPQVLVLPGLNQASSAARSQGSKITRLRAQTRDGEVREFEVESPSQLPPGEGSDGAAPAQEIPPDTPEPEVTPSESETEQPTAPTTPAEPEPVGVLEITSDRQEYNDQQQVVTAEGNVVLRFSQAVLSADRLQVNLQNRIAVAEGNVALRRGEQVLRGSRFEYYFVQDSGVIFNASGEIYQPTAERDIDISRPLPTDVSAANIADRPLSDRIIANQPLRRITTAEGYRFVVGSDRDVQGLDIPETGGTVNRLRFQAERVDFDAEGWIARNIRITNDPFSPPELELRADTARYRNIGPLQDEITTTDSRVVLDQGFSLPIFQDRIVLDRRPRDPTLLNFGFDGGDRGGLYAERSFDLVNTEQARFSVTPQYFLQKAIFEEGIIGPSAFGVEAELNATFSPRTTLEGFADLTSLAPDEIDDELRASLQLRQTIGNIERPHILNLEYSHRDRFYNGSLGFQTVRSSLGAVLTSPVTPLGDTGVNLNYQGGVQYITAETEDDELDTLTRYQAAAELRRGFLLWQGEALPPTPTEGLRYTSVPVLPYLRLTTGVTGVTSLYSNGDTQNSLSGTLGLQGQLGHFSRPFLDYTGFNLSYSQVVQNQESPFLFDRIPDKSVLSAGIVQQLYGPFRVGVQTRLNLNTGEEISTDYTLEYSRRTYNILLRYNPVLEIGSISFRISDFNWIGSPEPFDDSGIQSVTQGVTR